MARTCMKTNEPRKTETFVGSALALRHFKFVETEQEILHYHPHLKLRKKVNSIVASRLIFGNQVRGSVISLSIGSLICHLRYLSKLSII